MEKTMYTSKLTLVETEEGIKFIKDTFESLLKNALNLKRVSAPRFLEVGNGLQDDLAGLQQPVRFHVSAIDHPVEIVHSLAKWKRQALAVYDFSTDTGLYTDMDAIRKDEDPDDIHSIYVDQWDWEKVITQDHRNLAYLKYTVNSIYRAMKETERRVCKEFSVLESFLPEEITFIHTQQLEDKYPELSPKEREDKAAREYGAYFLIGIGGMLKSGIRHDARAADYDDWSSDNKDGYFGLNGDIIVYDSTRDAALELSSMGIRVDAESMERQLELMEQNDRKEMDFHRGVLEGTMPLSIGGGIGQSRLCMLLLQKMHIGEVQVSVWPKDMIENYKKMGVFFL